MPLPSLLATVAGLGLTAWAVDTLALIAHAHDVNDKIVAAGRWAALLLVSLAVMLLVAAVDPDAAGRAAYP